MEIRAIFRVIVPMNCDNYSTPYFPDKLESRLSLPLNSGNIVDITRAQSVLRSELVPEGSENDG